MSLLDDINNGNVPVFTDEYGRQFVWQTTGFDSGVPVYLDDLRKQIQPANSYAEQAKGLLGQWSSLIGLPQMQQYLSKIDTPEELAYMQAKFDPTKVPHLEELTYQLAGFGDQKNVDAWEKQQAGQQTTALENMLIDNPSMAGQSVVRPDIPDFYQGVPNPNAADGGPAYTQAVYDQYGVTEADYNQAATDWVTNNTAAAQAARDTDDGFGMLLGVGILLAVGIATGGFGLAGAGAEAGTLGAIGGTTAEGLAAADLAAGIGAAEAVGGTAAAATAAGASGGILNSVASGAIKGAAMSGVTGGDPLQGALTGGITGGLIGSGALNGVSSGISDAFSVTDPVVQTAISAGVNSAAGAGVSTAINGGSFGDVLESALISGAVGGIGNYVTNTVTNTLDGTQVGGEDAYNYDYGNGEGGISTTGADVNAIDLNSTIGGAAGGAAAGATGAVLTGGDVGNSILTGALAGGAGGLASDLGASAPVAGAVSQVTGAAVNSALQDSEQPNVPTPTPATVEPWSLGLSFSDLVPQFKDLTQTRADMKWGTRLSGRP